MNKRRAFSQTRQKSSTRGREDTEVLRQLGERIRAALLSYRVDEVAQKLEVSASAIYNWIAGVNEPGIAKLLALADITKISPAWLVVGQGLPDAVPGYVKPLCKIKPPPFAFEDGWCRANFQSQGARLLLQVPDDSMEPNLRRGDFVITIWIEPREEMPHTNGIYAFALKPHDPTDRWEDWPLIPRRVEWSSREEAILKCDNPAYPRVVDFKMNDPGSSGSESFEMVGPIVWHGRLL